MISDTSMDLKTFLTIWPSVAKMVLTSKEERGDIPSHLDFLLYAKQNPTASFQQTLKALSPALDKYKSELGKQLTLFGFFDNSKSQEANWEELEKNWKTALPELLKENEKSLNKNEALDDSRNSILNEADNKENAGVLNDGGNYIKKKDEADLNAKEEEKEVILEEPNDVIAPVQPALVQPAAVQPAANTFPKSHQEVLDRIREFSALLTSHKNVQRTAAAFLKKGRLDLNSEASVKKRMDTIHRKSDSLLESRDQVVAAQKEIDKYLKQKNNPIFGKNDQRALRKLRENMQTELEEAGNVHEKMGAELRALSDRYEELCNPVGSKQSLWEAVEAFEAIQDRRLSWRRTGGHAQQFNAIKESVRAWRNPENHKSFAEKAMDMYKACDAYLREHANNGKKIGGQGSEVGRLRKQAVVNLLQVLSKQPALQESLRQYEAERPARVKLNFAELEKSLAKASDAKVKLSKYEKGTKKKAYAELENAKDQMSR